MREFDHNDRTPVPNLRGGNGKTVAFVLGPLLGACVLVGGIIWTMAKYPDRAETDDFKREVRSALAEMRKTQSFMETNVAVMGVQLQSVQQSTARIETKLDKRK